MININLPKSDSHQYNLSKLFKKNTFYKDSHNLYIANFQNNKNPSNSSILINLYN